MYGKDDILELKWQNGAKCIWITKEVYDILRIQKRKQKISMAKIVCNLIFEKYR